jgi:hypothetical protein
MRFHEIETDLAADTKDSVREVLRATARDVAGWTMRDGFRSASPWEDPTRGGWIFRPIRIGLHYRLRRDLRPIAAAAMVAGVISQAWRPAGEDVTWQEDDDDEVS